MRPMRKAVTLIWWAARKGRTVGSLSHPSSIVTNTTGSVVATWLTTGGSPGPPTSPGGDDRHTVRVADHPVTGTDLRLADPHRAADAAAGLLPRSAERHAGAEHREAPPLQCGDVPDAPVDHDAEEPAGLGGSGQHLTPVPPLRGARNGDREHLAGKGAGHAHVQRQVVPRPAPDRAGGRRQARSSPHRPDPGRQRRASRLAPRGGTQAHQLASSSFGIRPGQSATSTTTPRSRSRYATSLPSSTWRPCTFTRSTRSASANGPSCHTPSPRLIPDAPAIPKARSVLRSPSSRNLAAGGATTTTAGLPLSGTSACVARWCRLRWSTRTGRWS